MLPSNCLQTEESLFDAVSCESEQDKTKKVKHQYDCRFLFVGLSPTRDFERCRLKRIDLQIRGAVFNRLPTRNYGLETPLSITLTRKTTIQAKGSLLQTNSQNNI